MKLADHAGQVLARMALADQRIVVLDGDLADSDGAIHFALEHPDRFLMAGIAEQNMVSVAAGMAATGLRPYVFSFAAFLCYRAYDQIRVCLSQAKQPVILVGSHAGGLLGRNGKTHAAPNDIALMLSLSGMQVWAPADFQDVELAMAESLSADQPTYIRLPRWQFTPEDNLAGKARAVRWLREPRGLSIVSTGLATRWAVDVADKLASAGLAVGVLHCPKLTSALVHELREARQLISIEDHYCFGGLASLLAEQCPGIPLTRFGWPAQFCGKSGSDADLLEHGGLSSDAIVEQILAKFNAAHA